MVDKEKHLILRLKRAFCITYGHGLKHLKKESLHLNRGLEVDQTKYWDINFYKRQDFNAYTISLNSDDMSF